LNTRFIDQNCCETTYRGTILNHYLKIILLSSTVCVLLKKLKDDKHSIWNSSFGSTVIAKWILISPIYLQKSVRGSGSR